MSLRGPPARAAICGHDAGLGCHGAAMAARYKAAMILYKPGTQFFFKGRLVTVDFVIIRKTGLWIRLAHSDEVCRPEDLTPVAERNACGRTEGAGSQ